MSDENSEVVVERDGEGCLIRVRGADTLVD